MSFDFLPLPLFILLIGGFAIYLMVYSRELWNKNYKLATFGLIILSLGGLSGVVYRTCRDLELFESSKVMPFNTFTIIATIIGVLLMFFDGLVKAPRNDKKDQ